MITVRRSDTGSYVLVHEPSQTVMVGEALDDTFARMQEHLREHPELPTTMAAPPSASGGRRGPWLVGIGVLALLPFLWLAVLHYTLGRMIDELRAEPPAPATASKEVEQLRSEVEQLRQVVSRVEDEVGRRRPGRTPLPAPAQSTSPEADDAEDEDEDEDEPAIDVAAIRKRGRSIAGADGADPEEPADESPTPLDDEQP